MIAWSSCVRPRETDADLRLWKSEAGARGCGRLQQLSETHLSPPCTCRTWEYSLRGRRLPARGPKARRQLLPVRLVVITERQRKGQGEISDLVLTPAPTSHPLVCLFLSVRLSHCVSLSCSGCQFVAVSVCLFSFLFMPVKNKTQLYQWLTRQLIGLLGSETAVK